MEHNVLYCLTHGGQSSWWYADQTEPLGVAIDIYGTLERNTRGSINDPHDNMHMLTYDPVHGDVSLNFTSDPYKGEPVVEGFLGRQQILEQKVRNGSCMEIHLDLDSRLLQFRLCQDGAVSGALEVRGQDAVDALEDSDNDERLLARALDEAALRWERIRGNNAVYTITDHGQQHCYYSEFAGGHYNALAIMSQLDRMKAAIRKLDGLDDANLLVNVLTWNPALLYERYAKETTVLEAISSEDAWELQGRLLEGYGDIGLCVHMDFDARTLILEQGPQNGSDQTMDLTFDDASLCLREIIEEMAFFLTGTPEQKKRRANGRTAELVEYAAHAHDNPALDLTAL